MDKDIRNYDIDDAKLIEAMQIYLAEPGRGTLLQLAVVLKESNLFVPVMENKKKQALQPYIIKNQSGELYVPAFTCVDKIPFEQGYEGIQRLPYKQCAEMLLNDTSEVAGIVLNPYADNLMLKKQMLELNRKIEEDLPKQQVTTMKAEDFHMLTRHNVEFYQIPQRVYAQKLAFIRELSAQALYELFKAPYMEVKQEKLCGYTADDFDFMELDIRDDLNIMQITLPSKHLYHTNCRELYLVWNPQTERIVCYGIEKDAGAGEIKFWLDEIREDGTFTRLEEAPSEGNIMNRVMELFEAQGL